jgi:hypothetical protein
LQTKQASKLKLIPPPSAQVNIILCFFSALGNLTIELELDIISGKLLYYKINFKISIKCQQPPAAIMEITNVATDLQLSLADFYRHGIATVSNLLHF